jgi:hypothetical protein
MSPRIATGLRLLRALSFQPFSTSCAPGSEGAIRTAEAAGRTLPPH